MSKKRVRNEENEAGDGDRVERMGVDEDEAKDGYAHQEEDSQLQLQEGKNSNKIDRKLTREKAMLEFRCLMESAILGNYLLGKPRKNLPAMEIKMLKEQLREITLWNVPLLPSKGHKGTDIVLMKFLRANDFKVQKAFKMLQRTLTWRKDFNADGILEENFELPDHLKTMNYMRSGRDKENHPFCFHIYEALQDKRVCQEIFETKEGCEKFLRWKIQFMEKNIQELDFEAGGVNSLARITDLKHSVGAGKKYLRSASKKLSMVVQEHYPEIIHTDIIVNAPFWYYASHVVSSKFSSQRTKGNVVFARPSKVTKTLLKFIAPGKLPVEYGGLMRENDEEFFPEDKVHEHIVKKNSIGCIQIPVTEVGSTIVWDLTVVGWEVSYKEEFVPDDEGSYRISLHKEKKKKGAEDTRNCSYIYEKGHIMVRIKNKTYKKKKVLYRYKIKPTTPMHIFIGK